MWRLPGDRDNDDFEPKYDYRDYWRLWHHNIFIFVNHITIVHQLRDRRRLQSRVHRKLWKCRSLQLYLQQGWQYYPTGLYLQQRLVVQSVLS